MQLFGLELVEQQRVRFRPVRLRVDLGIYRGVTGFETIDPADVAHTQSSNAKYASDGARPPQDKCGTRLQSNGNTIPGGKSMQNRNATGIVTW